MIQTQITVLHLQISESGLETPLISIEHKNVSFGLYLKSTAIYLQSTFAGRLGISKPLLKVNIVF